MTKTLEQRVDELQKLVDALCKDKEMRWRNAIDRALKSPTAEESKEIQLSQDGKRVTMTVGKLTAIIIDAYRQGAFNFDGNIASPALYVGVALKQLGIGEG